MKSAGSITGCYDNTGNIVFNQDEIEEAVLDHFKTVFQGENHPVYNSNTEPDQLALAEEEMINILGAIDPAIPSDKFEEKICSPMSFVELEKILGNLSNGKSSGYDRVPNELLNTPVNNSRCIFSLS